MSKMGRQRWRREEDKDGGWMRRTSKLLGDGTTNGDLIRKEARRSLQRARNQLG
jgi:hypothetical protein